MKENKSYVLRQLGILALLALLGFLLFCAGLMVGYAIVGNGDNPWDILSPSTWASIFEKFGA